MDTLFLKLLNLSITASWIVLAVIAVRFLIKKAPKFITCLLWIFVAVRLICPFSFESVLSLVPSAQTIPDAVITDTQFNINSGVSVIDNTVNPYLDDHYYAGVTASANTGNIVLSILGTVWLAGMILMLAYMVVSYLKIRKRVSAKIRLKDNIFICDEVHSPFIMGVFRPEIYLLSDMNEEQKEYVISHELAHLKRHDNLWKPLGFILLSVYWFNPVMWLAYILLCRDIEAACDEKVIKNMTDEERAGYSQALLDCGTNKKSVKVCPVTFGETGVKQRVKSVLNYKKPAFWIIIIAVIASIAVAVCFLTNPKKEEDYSYEYANIKITENLPSVLEISPYLDFQYKEVKHGIFSIERFKEIKVIYDEEAFAEANNQIAEKVSFLSESSISVFGYTVFESVSAEFSDYKFNIVADSESDYPENFWIIGINETNNQIIYIRVDASDLDYIKDLKDFLCDHAKIQNLMTENRSRIDEIIFHNKKGRISVTYYCQNSESEHISPNFTLNPNNRTATFSSSYLSSYFGVGKYELKGNMLIIKSDDGNYVLAFTKKNNSYFLDKENCLDHKRKIDTEAISADNYEFFSIPDGTEFATVTPDPDSVIHEVILTENRDKDWIGECYTEGHIILGSEENGNRTKIYALSEFSSFGFENGYFTNVGGECAPAVITVDKNTGAYSIQYPEDGEYYSKSIKKMFPKKYQSRAFGDNEKDGADMWKQCVAQAEEYLESIGRKAEVRSWGDVPHTMFENIGMPVEISNRLEDYLETYQFYNYLGYEEIIEGGVRYVYRTSYLTDKNTLLFSKEIFGENKVMNLIQMNIKTGEIISMANDVSESQICDFIDAEVVEFKDNILTVKANADGKRYKIDTASLDKKVKPDAFYDGLYVRIYCTGINTNGDGNLHNVFLIAVLGDVAEYGLPELQQKELPPKR